MSETTQSNESSAGYIPANAHPSTLLNKEQFATFINVSPATFDRLLQKGILPEPVNVGARRRLWLLKTITDWLEMRAAGE